MDVFDAITDRRSIRKFKEKSVEREKLEKILNAARWAPSWANTQCWRFIIVKKQETKEKLSDTLSRNNPARKSVMKAPIIIACCAEKKVSGYKKGESATEKENWVMFDCGLALQNLMLAAKALGLGTVQIGSFNSKKAEEILNIPSKMSLVTLTPLGYPKKIPKAPERKSLDEIVYQEKYKR